MTRYARPAIVLSFCALVATTAFEIRQTRDTMNMVLADLDYRPEQWMVQPVRDLVREEHARLYPPLGLPGPQDTNAAPSNAVLRMNLPFRRDGYLLCLSGREDPLRRPFRFECLVNGRPVGDIAGNDDHALPAQSGRLFLDPRTLSSSATNDLSIRFAGGHSWRGNVVLRPGAAASRLPLLFPLAAFLFLASLLFGVPAGRLSWGYPVALFAVFLAVYRLTFSADNIAPTAECFFSDEIDLMVPIMIDKFTSDTARHMLFLPFMHGLYRFCLLITSGEVQAMATAFALVGAANVTVASLWMRRFIPSFRGAGLAALLYGFAFSIWVYSSTYETCIPSSLAANAAMCVVLWPARRGVWMAAAAIALAVAALFQPPLLILAGVAARAIWNRGLARPVLTSAGIGLVVVALFLAGQVGIRSLYAHTEGHPKSAENARGVEREVLYFEHVFTRFAFREKSPLAAAGNVMMGQFVYAMAGLPWPQDWSRGGSGLLSYIRNPAALPACSASCSWAASASCSFG